jgi:hypothetical protein
MINVKNELEFWTEIMRDHGMFQYDNLSPSEVEVIQKAKYFMDRFSELNKEIKNLPENISPKQMDNIIEVNIKELNNFIKFKEELLTRLLKCSIKIGLTPSFVSHMINEALEYYRVLCMAQQRAAFNPALESLRLHKIWLRDASGHAASIASDLDAAEAMLVNKAQDFQKKFDSLSLKAFEMYHMYERTGVQDGIVSYFNKEVEEEITRFIQFLNTIKILRLTCRVLGALQPIIPDHMIREENYYLYRLKALYEV